MSLLLTTHAKVLRDIIYSVKSFKRAERVGEVVTVRIAQYAMTNVVVHYRRTDTRYGQISLYLHTDDHPDHPILLLREQDFKENPYAFVQVLVRHPGERTGPGQFRGYAVARMTQFDGTPSVQGSAVTYNVKPQVLRNAGLHAILILQAVQYGQALPFARAQDSARGSAAPTTLEEEATTLLQGVDIKMFHTRAPPGVREPLLFAHGSQVQAMRWAHLLDGAVPS